MTSAGVRTELASEARNTCTRFAPSPTGDLHLGGAWTALASWAFARAAGGRSLLRMEDIDTPRVVRGTAERIEEDLRWLGLGWDGPSVIQSRRHAVYEAALAFLERERLTYRCDCSRAEIARVASAPHPGEEAREAIYPGTCRDLPPVRPFKRPPAIRLRVPRGTVVRFEDAIAGAVEEDVGEVAGDFVLRRGDDVFAYQFVVAIDDAEMGVSDVIRANDLLASTARQLLLLQLLGYEEPPRYAHLPLVVAADGSRLAKRTRGMTVREIVAGTATITPATILGRLAHGLGLVEGPDRPLAADEIAARLTPPSAWRRTPWPIPTSWA
jgi:glutamyl-tRNA synthetase